MPEQDLIYRDGFEPYQPSPDEPYMSPGQEAHFRGILEHWRSDLMQEVDRTVGHMKAEATHYADPNDRATQESDIGLELRTRDRERKLLAKIGKSLAAIDEHEYGYCKLCGIEIGLRRLEARPTADMCIDCKTKQEQQEKQFT
jgi:DnaK suppressor protein